MRSLGILLLVASWTSPASAQPSEPAAEEPAATEEPAILESPTAEDPSEASTREGDVSDRELIRWASRELARADGRAPGERPPIPPDEYLRRSRRGGGVALPDRTERDVVRLLAELGLGALGAGLGGGAGALLIWAVMESRANPSWVALSVMGGTMLGAVGLTTGVTLGAHLAGGRGNWGQAFLGQLIGSAAALPLVVLALDNDALAAGLVAAGVLPLAGAVLGYEIGHGDAESGTSRPPVVAYAVPTRGGALGGVAGSLP